MKRRHFTPPYPGYFLELVRLHNWPPMFEPQPVVKVIRDGHAASLKSRQTALARGITGTISNLNGRAVVGDPSKAAVTMGERR